MYYPAGFQLSLSSGETQGVGVWLLYLCDLNLLGFGVSAASDTDGPKLHSLPPC